MTPKTRSKSSSKARPLSGAPQLDKPLPDDIQALQAMVRALQQAVSHRDDRITQLQHTIDQLQRQVYGTKSEKLKQALHDAELQLEDLVADQGQDPQREEPGLVDDDSKGDGHGNSDSPSSVLLDLPPLPDKPDAPRKPPGGRKPLPAHLPRDERRLTPAESVCTQCSGELKPLGDDVTERLDYVGAHFRVRRGIRPRCCCTQCGQIVQAPVAEHPLPKALLTAGTLAHLLSSKYADHCPLYRQREIYARDGLNLSLSSMAHWVGQAQGLLKPLVQALHQYVMAAPAAVHVDDTGLPVLGRVQGKAHRASLWVYVRDERPWAATSAPAVVFHYTHSREGKHPAEHLAGFAGAVQADAYSGFDQLFGEDSGRTEVGC